MVSEKMKKWTKKGIVWTLRFGTVGVLLFLLWFVTMEVRYFYRQSTPRGQFLNDIQDASGHIDWVGTYRPAESTWMKDLKRYFVRRYWYQVNDIDLSFLHLRLLPFERFYVLEKDPPFTLEMAYTNVNDQQLKDLSRMQNICLLNLSGCPNLTADGLRVLKNMHGLTDLHLSGTACTDAVCEELGSLPIEHIVLENTAVTGTCFNPKFGWKKLACISLIGCKIDPSFFENIDKLPSIQSIDISEYDRLLQDLEPWKRPLDAEDTRSSIYLDIFKDDKFDDRYHELNTVERFSVDCIVFKTNPNLFIHPFAASRRGVIPIHGWWPFLQPQTIPIKPFPPPIPPTVPHL